MYATATQNAPSLYSAKSMSSVYKQIGVETAIVGTEPHRLITMLYDGALESIAQARGALAAKDIEAKCRHISKAVRIVEEGLRGGVDLRVGGELAQNLHALYGYIATRLTQANLRSDDAALEECVRLLSPLREAWLAIRTDASAQTLKKEVMA
jgi:flagellar secretion chaperone FliS